MTRSQPTKLSPYLSLVNRNPRYPPRGPQGGSQNRQNQTSGGTSCIRRLIEIDLQSVLSDHLSQAPEVDTRDLERFRPRSSSYFLCRPSPLSMIPRLTNRYGPSPPHSTPSELGLKNSRRALYSQSVMQGTHSAVEQLPNLEPPRLVLTDLTSTSTFNEPHVVPSHNGVFGLYTQTHYPPWAPRDLRDDLLPTISWLTRFTQSNHTYYRR